MLFSKVESALLLSHFLRYVLAAALADLLFGQHVTSLWSSVECTQNVPWCLSICASGLPAVAGGRPF